MHGQPAALRGLNLDSCSYAIAELVCRQTAIDLAANTGKATLGRLGSAASLAERLPSFGWPWPQ